MVAALAGVAVRGALLVVAVDLADERVDVDDQPPVAGAGARRPRARERLGEHAVELADVPERERAQERAERRRRRTRCPSTSAVRPDAQHVAVVDAVRARAPSPTPASSPCARVRRPGTLAEIDALIDQRLDPQPPGQRRRQHDPRVGDRPLIVEDDRDAVQSDRPVNCTMKVTSCAGRDCRNSRFPCSGGHSSFTTGQTRPTHGGSRLSADRGAIHRTTTSRHCLLHRRQRWCFVLRPHEHGVERSRLATRCH